MNITYDKYNFGEKLGKERQTFEDFFVDTVLYKNDIYPERICLEKQPAKVCGMVGRLIEKLVEKGLFNIEDVKYIADCDYGRKADSLAIEKRED